MAAFDIVGAAELQKTLRELPVQIEKNVLRGALRVAGKVFEAEAESLVPVDDGDLKESIRVSAGAKRNGRVWAHVKAGGKKAPHAHLVEFGTRPHEIRPKGAVSLFFAGIFSKVIQHPGSKPQSFMRRAFDRKAAAAIAAFVDYAKGRIEKLAKAKK